MKRLKISRITKFIICLFLTCLLFVDEFRNVSENNLAINNELLVVNAANNEKEYISEIVVEHGQTRQEVVDKLEASGYQIFDKDLNAHTGDDYVYLGYKTCKDSTKAIRKISLMDENGGYSPFDYNEFIEKQTPSINLSVEEFINALADFKEKLTIKTMASSIALEALNVYCVPDSSNCLTGEPLGDYLISEARTSEQIKTFLLHANSLAISNAYEQIALGTIDENSNNSWVNRLISSISKKDELLENIEEYEEYYQQNETTIKIIKNNIATFFEDYEIGMKEYNKNGGIDSAYDEKSSLEQLEEDLKGNDASSDNNKIGVLGSYSFLNSFSYNETDESTLLDFFKNINNESGEDLIVDMIILLKSLSAGQLLTLKSLGLSSLCSYSSLIIRANAENLSNNLKDQVNEYNAESSLEKVKEELEEKEKDVRDIFYKEYGVSSVSVWISSNKELLEKDVAITSEALRSNAAANEFKEINATNELSEECKKALTIMSYCIEITSCIAVISFSIGTLVFKCGISGLICLGIGTMMGYASATVCSICFSIVGVISVAISILIVAAIIVCALVYLVNYLIDLWNYYNPDYSSIPDILIDRSFVNDESVYSTYYVVKDLDGNNADINAFMGAKWNALYVSYDEEIGSPLTSNDLENYFYLTEDINSIPTNATPVCKFGQINASNLNMDTYDEDETLYLYYYTVDDVNNNSINTTGKYIESVNIKCEENIKAAIDALKVEGYLTIDVNLSEDADYATAIGYKLTDNKDQAVTDIRLSVGSTEDAMYYGDTTHSYGKASTLTYTVSEDETDFPVTLYYSKSSEVGTPILSDINDDGKIEGFGITYNIDDIPEGKEGINFFSGGIAYDFNSYNEEGKSDWDNHCYVYFRPSVEYSKSNSELYVSGFGLVSGSNDYSSQYPISSYAKSLGYSNYLNKSYEEEYIDITKGVMNDEKNDVSYLLPSYTYNPYRAISKIAIFTAEVESSYLTENIISKNNGYIAIPCYTQGDLGYYDSTWYEGRWRTIRSSHAYITNIDDEGEMEKDDYLICPRAFYVSGVGGNNEPLKATDLYATNVSEVPKESGYNSVHDIKSYYYDSYNEDGTLINSGTNLAASTSNSFYLYYKGEQISKGKYISAIYAKSGTDESCSYNTAILSLINAGAEEIIETNISNSSRYSWSNPSSSIFINEDEYEDNNEDYDDYHIHTFIGYTYTNRKADAIGCIKTYMIDDENEVPSKNIKLSYNIDGKIASFERCSDLIVDANGSKYYLYTSKSGTKISNVSLGIKISSFINKTIDNIDRNEISYTAFNQDNKIESNLSYYIYYGTSESYPYIDKISYRIGSLNDETCVKELVENGAVSMQIYQMGSKYLYIGLSKTTSLVNAIKDIKIIESYDTLNFTSTLSFNGREYEAVSEQPINISLNDKKKNVYLLVTYGGKTDKQYALIDLYLGNINNDNYECAISLNSQKEVNICDGTSETMYLLLSHKNGLSWGMYGPLAASIFTDNPSILVIIVFSLLLVLAGIGLFIYKKKRIEKK